MTPNQLPTNLPVGVGPDHEESVAWLEFLPHSKGDDGAVEGSVREAGMDERNIGRKSGWITCVKK